MGQQLCSFMTSSENEFKENYFHFQFGEDQKQANVQHDQAIQYKPFLNLQEIVKTSILKLKQSKCLYKDPAMPSQKLILKSISKENKEQKQIQAFFMRPYKFLNSIQKGQSYKVFSKIGSNCDQILVKDEVMQYFGVFLCFVADHSKIIQSLILTDANSYGLMAVKMYLSSKEQIVYLDDYILCTPEGPLFSQPIKNLYLWPNLLEKAWLKTTGFTDNIIARSSPEEVFESFLSHPYKKFKLSNSDEMSVKERLNKYLFQSDQEYGYILTTKTNPQIHIGLTGKKYLYLIGSFVFDKKRLFYVRNPCGRFNFRGEFDQINEELQNQIKSQFKRHTIQQGNFILSQNQFIEQVAELSICYYSNQLKNSNLVVQLQNNSEIFIQTQIKQYANVCFCFRQRASRRSENKFSPLTYQIFNLTTGQLVAGYQNLEACFGLYNSYLFPEIIKKLPPSKYLIRLKKRNQSKHYFAIESLLIAWCSHELKFDMKNQLQFTTLFRQNLRRYGKTKLHQKKGGEVSRQNNSNPIEHIVYMIGDLICLYIEYVGLKEQEYRIQISFPKLKNLEMIYPEIDLVKTSVLPQLVGFKNKEYIIVFQKIDLTAETELGYFELQAF